MEDQEQMILASAGYDHTIKFWQAQSGICQRTCEHPDSQVNALQITNDASLIAAAGYQHIRLYDLQANNPNPVINFDGVSKNVTGVVFQKDNKWMATSGEDNAARVWDLRARSSQCSRTFKMKSSANCICLHPNQVEVFIGDQNGSILRWDMRADKSTFEKVPEENASILSIDIDVTASLMASVNNKGNCHVFNVLSTKVGEASSITEKQSSKVHPRQTLKCRFSPDSTLLATTSADSSLKLWRTADMSNMSLATTLKASQQRWVWDCAFSLDSRYIFSASSDQLVRLWEVDTGACCRQFTGHQKAVTAVAFKEVV